MRNKKFMIKALKVILIVVVFSFSLLRFVHGNLSAQPFEATVAVTYPVAVTISGAGGGSVNSKPSGLASTVGTRSFNFQANSTITLFATADKNSIFAGWSGDCTNATGDCVVTMDTAKKVTASFVSGPSIRAKGAGKETVAAFYPLEVTISGTGGGSVFSKPRGLASTGGSRFFNFQSNSTVTLFATTDGNSTFTGWSGDCTNSSGDCVVTMDSAKNVTASFDRGPFIRTTGGDQ